MGVSRNDLDTIECKACPFKASDEKTKKGKGSKEGAVRNSERTWINTFEKVLNHIEINTTIADDKKYRFLTCNNPVPFQEVFCYFVHVGATQLSALQNGYKVHLSENAKIDLEKGLLSVLSGLATPSLELNFSLFKWEHESIFQSIANTTDKNEGSLYNNFIKGLLKGGLINFFKEHSVLAKLTALFTDFWVASCLELTKRLNDDWSELCERFGLDAQHAKVKSLVPLKSDLHNACRTVTILEFNCGKKIVYKPRSMDMEEAYYQLLKWLNPQMHSLPFKLVGVINKRTYGWMEYVEYADCKEEKDIADFYYQAGRILFLLFVLHGRDFVYDNIIACGNQPVLIDIETLLHPSINDKAPYGSERYFKYDETCSVLRTDLLPTVNFNHGKSVYDYSGLGTADRVESPFPISVLKGINSDNMRVEFETHIIKSFINRPMYKGKQAKSTLYVNNIVDGFVNMYSVFKENQQELVKGPIAKFNNKQSRFLLRPTMVYENLLLKLLHPKYLKNAKERSNLIRAFCEQNLNGEYVTWQPLLLKEMNDLEEMNVPYFTISTSRASPNYSKSAVCMEQPGIAKVTRRIKDLNTQVINQQVQLIKNALC